MKTKLILFISILVLIGCNKYPEGPKLSIRSFEKRLNQTFELETYLVNGVDSTARIKSEFYHCNRLILTKYDNGHRNFKMTSCNNQPVPGADGFFYASKKSNEVKLIGGYSGSFNGALISYPAFYELTDWQIIRLSMKEFWIEGIHNSITYQLKWKRTQLS